MSETATLVAAKLPLIQISKYRFTDRHLEFNPRCGVAFRLLKGPETHITFEITAFFLGGDDGGREFVLFEKVSEAIQPNWKYLDTFKKGVEAVQKDESTKPGVLDELMHLEQKIQDAIFITISIDEHDNVVFHLNIDIPCTDDAKYNRSRTTRIPVGQLRGLYRIID